MNHQVVENTLITLLVIAAAGLVIYFHWEAWRMEQDMKRIQEGERDTDPQPYTPDPEHIKRVLAEYGLRKTLPVYAKRDPGTSEAEAHDIADLKRGTSDNLRGLLP